MTAVVGLSRQKCLELETGKCTTKVPRHCRVSQARIPRGWPTETKFLTCRLLLCIEALQVMWVSHCDRAQSGKGNSSELDGSRERWCLCQCLGRRARKGHFHSAWVMKTLRQCCGMNAQTNGIEQRMQKQTCVDLEMWQRQHGWLRGKRELFDKQSYKKCSSIWEKRKSIPYPTPYKNKHLQSDLTVKEKSWKTSHFRFQILDLIENVSKYLLDLGAGKVLLYKAQKVLILEILKQKNIKWHLEETEKQITNKLA